MRFYTGQHTYYGGIDLRSEMMFVCVLDQRGEVLLQQNTFADPKSFLKAVEPFRDDLVNAHAEAVFERVMSVRGIAEKSAVLILPEILILPDGMAVRPWVAHSLLRLLYLSSDIARLTLCAPTVSRYTNNPLAADVAMSV